MANEEKELFKFINDPKYREKVIQRVHKEQDALYNKRIKNLRSEKDSLISSRTKEISRISNARWESVADGKLLVNRTEGKVKINQSDVFFSDIQGAELNVQTGCRIITQENVKSKKHASLGGAVVGGLIAGPLGAVTGGSVLGKTKSKGTSTANQIPTYNHIGVLVNIKGFVSEIVVLSHQVDQSSSACTKAQNDAQNIISKLRAVSQLPVPKTFLRVEDEQSVKNYDAQILNKEKEIQVAVDDRPTYDIPLTYRTEAQKEMSDEEYLSYLAKNDQIRAEQIAADAAEAQRQKNIQKELKRQQKQEAKAERIRLKEELKLQKANLTPEERLKKEAEIKEKINISSTPIADGFVSVTKKVLTVLIKVVCWTISVFVLLLAIAALTQGGITSTIFFVISALSVNPLIYKFIKSKWQSFRKWMCIVIFIVTFLVSCFALPTTTPTTNTETPPSSNTEVVNQ